MGRSGRSGLLKAGCLAAWPQGPAGCPGCRLSQCCQSSSDGLVGGRATVAGSEEISVGFYCDLLPCPLFSGFVVKVKLVLRKTLKYITLRRQSMTSPKSDAAPPAAATTGPEVPGKGDICPPTRVPRPCPPRRPTITGNPECVALLWPKGSVRPELCGPHKPEHCSVTLETGSPRAALPVASGLEHVYAPPFLCL